MSKHLAKGSEQPPKVDGKLRLYSMQFCPFAQRARIVLLAKGIPHDIVNVHLKNKPEWIFDLYPEGKVPVLDTGSQVVIESLDISDFLDEQYPEPPLYPTDSEKRQQDTCLIKSFDQLIMLYYKTLHNEEKKSYSEHMQAVLPILNNLESELEKRGVYFGGVKPSMVDFMLWRWGERAPLLGLVFGEELPSTKEFPHIYSWCKAMRTQKPIQQTETSLDRHFKVQQQYLTEAYAIDYDSI